jgi:uncharacterized protein (TIGR02646 family)
VIQLALGLEPESLARVRQTRLAAAAAALAACAPNQYGPLRDELTGYRDAVVHRLHSRQYGKCAWCERHVGEVQNPIEHVRPKGGVYEPEAAPEPLHYWWLAWTWENLVFACASCNSKANKGNRFPIQPGTQRLEPPLLPLTLPYSAEWFDVSNEQPLLVDPRRENPLNFLEWKVVDRTVARPNWKWHLVGRDEGNRGETTRKILGLNELEVEVNAHIRAAILPRDAGIRKLVARNSLDEARTEWESLVATVVMDSVQPYRAAAWWALFALWPRRERQPLGFADPPIPRVSWPEQ